MRRAKGLIRRIVAKMGPIEAKKFLFTDLSIPSDAGTDFSVKLSIPLIVAGDTVDEELESDGTNIAQVTNYSKLVGIKGQIRVTGMGTGTRVRWMLLKQPDGEDLVAGGLIDSAFHSSNDNPTNRELRATTLAKGILYESDKTSQPIPLFVKRKTLRRLGTLRESDRITLVLAQNTTDACEISGFGTLYARMK